MLLLGKARDEAALQLRLPVRCLASVLLDSFCVSPRNPVPGVNRMKPTLALHQATMIKVTIRFSFIVFAVLLRSPTKFTPSQAVLVARNQQTLCLMSCLIDIRRERHSRHCSPVRENKSAACHGNFRIAFIGIGRHNSRTTRRKKREGGSTVQRSDKIPNPEFYQRTERLGKLTPDPGYICLRPSWTSQKSQGRSRSVV